MEGGNIVVAFFLGLGWDLGFFDKESKIDHILLQAPPQGRPYCVVQRSRVDHQLLEAHAVLTVSSAPSTLLGHTFTLSA